jgi:hypothetical protein
MPSYRGICVRRLNAAIVGVVRVRLADGSEIEIAAATYLRSGALPSLRQLPDCLIHSDPLRTAK